MAYGIRTGDLRGFSSVKVHEFDKHLKKASGYVGRNVVEITIVRKPIMIKITPRYTLAWSGST